MKNRSELREIICKLLYEIYILDGAKVSYNIKNLIKEQIEIENNFVNEAIDNIVKYQNDINTVANKYLIDWEIDRLSKMDKAIISLAIYELMYTDTPCVVVINEAVELSKKYSDTNVTSMINASLDKLYHSGEINDR